MEKTIGETFLGKGPEGKFVDVTIDNIKEEAKVVALYFSAHWCPPCR